MKSTAKPSKGGGGGSGVKITIGLSNSQTGSNNSAPLSSGSASTPQIPENLSTIVTISDLCLMPDGRKLENKRKRKEIQPQLNEPTNKGPKNQSSRRSQRQETENLSGPQVEIINGKIVIKESSLTVPSMSSEHEDFEEVEEGIHSTAKYSSFAPSTHSSAWGVDETRRFYETLRQCGTDFSLMQAFFPRRTRKQLKNKFIREENHHPELVKAVLNSQVPLDLAPFEVHLGTILPDQHREPSGLDSHQSMSDESGAMGAPQAYSYPLPEGLLFDDPELVDV